MRCACLFLLIALGGCVHATSTPGAPASAPSAPAFAEIEPDTIALDLDPQSCVCHLSNVDIALMSLPGVARLSWQAEAWQVTMHFLDDRRPTDAEIGEAMQYTEVAVKAIRRP